MRILGWSGALWLLQVGVAHAQTTPFVRARYWEIHTDHWRSPAAGASTPERPRLDSLRPYDVGIAFSGGGNRSSTATLGQLRGLQRNGWLNRVRYISAISGGAWAAVPYVFFPDSVERLLGVDLPLTEKNVEAINGLMAERIVNSSLYKLAAWEVPSFLPANEGRNELLKAGKAARSLRGVVRTTKGNSLPDADRLNKSYAHVLGQTFLDALIPGALQSSYAWDRATAIEMSEATGRQAGEFLFPPKDRPFLVVGGTLVKPGGDFPSLVPVEYTPLYTGVRQQFGVIGGTYVWPWAYDRQYAAPSTSSHVLVGPSRRERLFTLSDVIASTGAAPQLALIMGAYVPDRFGAVPTFAAGLFPSFSNVTIRGTEPNAPTPELPHGDGGFVDNLGLMPLLVRQVRNIIVFVNSSSHYTQNGDLQSYFMPVGPPGPTGDKRMNVVFDTARYRQVLDGLDSSTAAGGAAIYCDKDWKVGKNETYNSAEYAGLNICWVYNHAAKNWKDSLPVTIQSWIGQPVLKPSRCSCGPKVDERVKLLSNFPYFSTFGQNKPELIQLKPLQVNLLSDLTSWSITNAASVKLILDTFTPGVLLPPQSVR